MIGAGRQHVAGLERVDGADPLDAARDLVGHVAGVEILLEHAVDPEPHLKLMRIADFIGRDDVGAHRRKRVARLHLVEDVAGRRQAARRAVDEIDVSEYVAHRVGGFDVFRPLADDHRNLGLALEYGGGHIRQHHGVLRTDHRVGRLVEGVDRRRLGARAVLHVVDGHAVDVHRLRQRRTDLHVGKRHALVARRRLLQSRPILGESLDQPVDQIVRAGMRDVLHHGRDVDDGLAFDHAELVVVEVHQLHVVLRGSGLVNRWCLCVTRP